MKGENIHQLVLLLESQINKIRSTLSYRLILSIKSIYISQFNCSYDAKNL